jgi:hypothetical protein
MTTLTRAVAMPITSLLVAALVLPGCRLKPRADMPQLREAEVQAPLEDTGLRSVFISLNTGPTPKPAVEPVTVRIRWRDQVIATEIIGRGQRWEPYSTRAIEFPLSPPIRMDAPGALVLEISKPAVADGPWAVQVEALGRLTDRSIVMLLERTDTMMIGAGAADRVEWVLLRR